LGKRFKTEIRLGIIGICYTGARFFSGVLFHKAVSNMFRKKETDAEKTDRIFMGKAIGLARTRSSGGDYGPFGAVVVKDGRIVGRGWNRVVRGRDPSAHAEIVAIRDACARLKTHVLDRCTLYASCEPCPMCLSAIYGARIDRVVFAASRDDAAAAGFDDELLYREMARNWNSRAIPWKKMMEKEGASVVRRWARNPRKVPY
jgi:guanine deaminase